MSEAVYNLYQAKTSLSQLVNRAAKGETIIIAKAGIPLVKLVPVRAARQARQPGGLEGRVFIAEDFDEPLVDDM
jgi:prevent-host-death family protein